MSNGPFMPKATAVWLVENTTLSFKQIANFCNLHELEVKGIADGDVAKGIKAYNPILAGQLTREEIDICSKDNDKSLRLNIKNQEVVVSKERKKVKYTPLSKRKDKPVIINVNIGTTVKGAVDDLEGILTILKELNCLISMDLIIQLV